MIEIKANLLQKGEPTKAFYLLAESLTADGMIIRPSSRPLVEAMVSKGWMTKKSEDAKTHFGKITNRYYATERGVDVLAKASKKRRIMAEIAVLEAEIDQ